MSRWHGPWFGDWHLDWFGMDGSPFLAGYGPGGVATLVLDLEEGFTVHHSWVTDVIKFKGGVEQRISRNDVDRERYSGKAYLAGEGPRTTRARLARHAAAGSAFLLAMPHEELSIAEIDGQTVTVDGGSVLLVDWAKEGQRVVVKHRGEDDEPAFTNAVIQSVDGDEITLDVSSANGTEIAPCRHIFLEPQQDFPRYPVEVELWDLQARCAFPLDFAPTLARLDLSFLTANLLDAVVLSRVFGLAGNEITFALDPAGIGVGALVEGGGHAIFYFEPGVTTAGDLADALESSAYILLTGDYNPLAVLDAGDELATTNLAGALDSGDVGTGATVTTYDFRPVWDRKISNDDTIADGVHAMTQIIDHGGIPYALGTADNPDHFRTVAIVGGSRAEWQWFKRFMSEVGGRQIAFWLPTWREDLVYVSHVDDTLTIDADSFTEWYPSQRDRLQVLYDDGTVSYVNITAAVNNGDGTRTLTLGSALSGTVEMISWLEPCRFESDEYSTQHSAEGFAVSMVARVVPPTGLDDLSGGCK